MSQWVAIAYGALDISDYRQPASEAELMLLSTTLPGEPIGLAGEPAALWRKLATSGPVHDDQLTDSQRELVRQFAEAGIAANDRSHSFRHHGIAKPWMGSPLHELLYALIASLARGKNIDIVFIKGPILHRQQLREREHSGDIDIWVDSTGLLHLAALLHPWGWRPLDGRTVKTPIYHSLTLRPAGWGCELDLHRHMPGCALSDRQGLNELLKNTQSMGFAGVQALVPNRMTHAMICALHLARPHPYVDTPYRHVQVAQVLQRVGPKVIQTSNTFKATAALEQGLRHAFPGIPFHVDHHPPANWRWRQQSNPLRRITITLQAIPKSQWLAYLRKTLWPDAGSALRIDILHGRSSSTAFTARIRRIQWAFKAARVRRNKKSPLIR